MDCRFTGKVCVVTGSSTGIGRATAVLFAKDGAKVTITGRQLPKLEETKQNMIAAGAQDTDILLITGDITLQETREQLINETIKKFGKLDILVNNAGARLHAKDGSKGFHEPVQVLNDTFNVNVNSVLELTNLARPHLKSSHGEIVNISSIAGKPFAWNHSAYYAMSKAALDQMTRAQAAEFIHDGIRVNSVNPGLVRTQFMANTGVEDQTATKVYDYYNDKPFAIPRQEVGRAEEIAEVVAFLADRTSSSYVIGQTIVADGGSTLVLGMQTVDLSQIIQ